MAREESYAETSTASEQARQRSEHGDATPSLAHLVRAIAAFIGDALRLFALEGRLAVVSLIVMLAAGICAAVMVISVWLLLMGTVAAALVVAGWPWVGILPLIAVANLVLALICWLVIRHLSGNLLFTVSRRSLQAKSNHPSND
ncbi:MAG: hypothetical protein M3120_09315 [Pseudomonadota bacterium]|nr:hypothetical protein [Pseudomonadota bacterium]